MRYRRGKNNFIFEKFLGDESGAGMVEYLLLTALIAIAAIEIVDHFQEEISRAFYNMATELGRMTK